MVGHWIRGRWVCVWGAPDVCPKSLTKTLQNKGFGAIWTENGGAPKVQTQRPRIQRPILGPLNLLFAEIFMM